jgi:hypothetical protein
MNFFSELKRRNVYKVAINYAQNRASFRSGEIRILDLTGNIERIIAFSEADRKLCCRDSRLR